MARTGTVRQQPTISSGTQRRYPQQRLTTAYSTFAEIKWIVYTLTAIGLLPFYTIDNDYKISPTHRKRLITTFYTTGLRALCILLPIASIYLIFSPIGGCNFHIFGSVDSVNVALHVLLTISCFLTITLGCAWKSHDFQQIVNKLLLIDQQLQARTSLAPPIHNDCAFYRRYLVQLCILIVLAIQVILFSKNISTSSLFSISFYVIENTISNLFVIFIALLCHLLAMRFRYLNAYAKSFANEEKQQLSRCSRSLDPSIFYVILPEERHYSAPAENPFINASSFIYRMHYDLLRMYKLLNDYVGPALLMYFVYIIYVISAIIYFMAKRKSLDRFILWHTSSLYLHISIIALVSCCCSTLTKEAHQMSAIISSIYGRNEKCRKILIVMDVLKQQIVRDLMPSINKIVGSADTAITPLRSAAATD
ncbi:gustatory and pheromone receptor 32a-like [Bactrocera neohumeralis]|uniref:gustatory and pheromone receptor 32a-like n=1 Tax=Bactrocera neohumeralis TaxID=98809 RepID=UPI0021664643|nr:gustatory and pheromone receptor 32a-like [Bactrocera neohumeralis]